MRLNHGFAVLLAAASTCAYAADKPGCQYLTQQETATLVGEPVKPGMDFGMTFCNSSTVAGSLSVQSGVRSSSPDPVHLIDSLVKVATTSHYSTSPISGLGDRAILIADAQGGLTLDVAAKGQLVFVAIKGSKKVDTPAHREAMINAAKLIISRL